MDVEYVLGVISDGPTKSFAFRRLRYLASKWSMYTLIHEYEEMADMKVWHLKLSFIIIEHRIDGVSS
jgi:AMP deaminase